MAQDAPHQNAATLGMDRNRLPIAFSAVWLMLALPISQELYDSMFDGAWMRLFALLCVASPIWLLFGWRWLSHGARTSALLRLIVTAMAFVLSAMLAATRDHHDIAYVPLCCVVAFWLLLGIVEGISPWATKAIANLNASKQSRAKAQNIAVAFDTINETFLIFLNDRCAGLDTLVTRTGQSLKQSMQPHLRIVALKVAYMVVRLVLAKQSSAWLLNEDGTYFKLMVAGRVAHNMQSEMHHTRADERRSKALAATAKELVQCDTAVARTIDNFAASAQFPLDPVLSIVNAGVELASGDTPLKSTPQQRDEAYNVIFKEMVAVCERKLGH